MNETVVSEFNKTIWLKAVIFTLFVFSAIVACISICITDSRTYNWGQFVLIVIFRVY